jgi:hypothetical protein
MPTGYTACIEDGASFEQFVWGCARGMGACIMMRDEPWDTPIPDAFEPSIFYKDNIKEIEAAIDAIRSMTDEEIAERQVSDNAKVRADNEKYRLAHEENKRRYRAIKERVMAWNPPSADHEGLKEFMLEQIETSIGGRREDYYYKQEEKRIVSADEWRKEAMADKLKDLTRSKEEWLKEQERTAGRNRWIKQLRESIPQPEPFKKAA